MNYLEAFNNMINRFGLDILDDNFMVRSFLSDLIGNSYSDNQLLNSFNELNKDKSIYHSIRNYSLGDAKNHIKRLILNSSKTYSVEQYIHSVEPLLFYLHPNEYVHYEARKVTATTIKVNKVKPANKVQFVTTYVDQMKKNNKKPKPKKRIEVPDSITINATCKKLIVTYGYDNDIVFLKNGQKAMSSVTVLHRANGPYMYIDDKRNEYKIQLPKKKYEKIRVIYQGKDLCVASENNRRMNIEQLEVESIRGNTTVISNCESSSITQKRGTILFMGKMNNIHMKKSRMNAEIRMVNNNIQKDLILSMEKYQINTEFVNHKIKPKIGNPYQKTKRVKGTYNLGGERVRLEMRSKYGDILVK